MWRVNKRNLEMEYLIPKGRKESGTQRRNGRINKVGQFMDPNKN